MKQLHFSSYKLQVTDNKLQIKSYRLQVTGDKRKGTRYSLLVTFLLFCSFALYAQQSDSITLNLQNPTYPTEFIFTSKGCWDQTYNDVDYNPFISQIFSFTHNIEGAGSCYGGYVWSGFTVCNSGDNTNHSSQGWVMNYEWGCMAGGGIKTDSEDNVMLDGNGDVVVEKGIPYLVSYWEFIIDPLWWHLGLGNTFINAPVHCLKISLDEEEYEAIGVYVNNHPWTYYSNKYGDYARPLNQEGDYVKLFFHGLHPDGSESGKFVEFLLAKYEGGQLYQNEKWEWLDLSSLGAIGGIYCTMETTVCSGTGGPQTPTYFCIDKLQVRLKEAIVHISVSDIINVPTVAAVGKPLAITGTVIPPNATSQKIIWNVKDTGTTGATIIENVLHAIDTGTVIITATITDGIDVGVDFIKEFTINVLQDVVTFVITATVNNSDFGIINPAGEIPVEQGGFITFFITAFDKYEVSDVVVNGNSQGATTTYIFENVQKDGTIDVIFINKADIEENDYKKYQIYSHNNYVYIKNQSVNEKYFVNIFNMAGRLVYQSIIQEGDVVIPLDVVSGVYNVVLHCRDSWPGVSTKIYINTP
ncbi:MAG: DUF4465 domain-containing protein [Bacteroidales bacterium]|jgi:hypothetical protein|nr:DUF4465 domain-containing protein [Bacteroidales bacterium]